MDLGLIEKTVLVTGSTAGIGFATASRFAEEDARVIVNGRSETRVADAVSAIARNAKSARVTGVAADVSTVEGVRKLTAAVPDVDVLINNAGIFEPKSFEEIPDEDWLLRHD
jgi:NAD(P)-dependent dehydrogenase (short-subunit alcohol dehydrogenase family)